jgi:hypothetical protein
MVLGILSETGSRSTWPARRLLLSVPSNDLAFDPRKRSFGPSPPGLPGECRREGTAAESRGLASNSDQLRMACGTKKFQERARALAWLALCFNAGSIPAAYPLPRLASVGFSETFTSAASQ